MAREKERQGVKREQGKNRYGVNKGEKEKEARERKRQAVQSNIQRKSVTQNTEIEGNDAWRGVKCET